MRETAGEAVPMMLLTWEQIATVLRELGDVRQYVDSRRSVEPLAAHIQFPKMPPTVTESIVALLIRQSELLLPGVSNVTDVVKRPNGDLLVEADSQQWSVEVKGTADNRFTHLSRKDVAADYLVWFAFDADWPLSRRAEAHVIVGPSRLGFVEGRLHDDARLRRLTPDSVWQPVDLKRFFGDQ
jgi:hypothetical protein